MRYRGEIDGLRALAVVPVIFFHAGLDIFKGGFVGVDVFFVISGYLITTIILNEKEAGSFSIVKFYERRARRILPALFFVVIATIPFAWVWLLPADMKEYALSISAVATFVSNIFFGKESGYFSIAAELKPLLHTWSLAVEEQYYIFFPLFVMAAWKYGKQKMALMLAVIALLSLGYAEWAAVYDPETAFYILPTRAWELLIGVLIAFYFVEKPNLKSNDLLGFLGVALIVYAIITFDRNTPFQASTRWCPRWARPSLSSLHPANRWSPAQWVTGFLSALGLSVTAPIFGTNPCLLSHGIKRPTSRPKNCFMVSS